MLSLFILPLPQVQAGQVILPVPGTMVSVSPAYNPPILKGIKVHSEDPFRFEFILDQGSDNTSLPGDISQRDVSSSLLPNELGLNAKAPEGAKQTHRSGKITDQQLKMESTKLIKYFLASLTTPEKDLWVNLSPYEKDRIVPESFGQTEMGRDLLAQDYLLKQLTASLIYPEGNIGKEFWKRLYQASENKNIPINTFNKVWIVPNKAVIYENVKAGTAYVVESSLEVLLEADYLAIEKNNKNLSFPNAFIGNPEKHKSGPPMKDFEGDKKVSIIVKDIVIPQLTKEINEGANFAQLRQVYNSLILATWYKKKIRDSILSQVYSDKNKVKGTEYNDALNAKVIYQQYLEAFKKGTYNYIKDEQDPISKKLLPRKYFSGGVKFGDFAMSNSSKAPQVDDVSLVFVSANLVTDSKVVDWLGMLPSSGIDPTEVSKHTKPNRHAQFDQWFKTQEDFKRAKQFMEIGLGGYGSPTFFEFASLLSFEQNLIGVDVEQHIVDRVNDKVGQGDKKRIEARQGVLGEDKEIVLPGTMDVIRTFNVLQHYYFSPPQTKAMHQHITRMLRDKGVYVEEDYSTYIYARKARGRLFIEKLVVSLNELRKFHFSLNNYKPLEAIEQQGTNIENKIDEIVGRSNMQYREEPHVVDDTYLNIFADNFKRVLGDSWTMKIQENMMVIERNSPQSNQAMTNNSESDFTPRRDDVQQSNFDYNREHHFVPLAPERIRIRPLLMQLASADSGKRQMTAKSLLQEFEMDAGKYTHILINNFIDPVGIEEARKEFESRIDLSAEKKIFSEAEAYRNARSATLFALMVRIKTLRYNVETYNDFRSIEGLYKIKDVIVAKLLEEQKNWKQGTVDEDRLVATDVFLGHKGKEIPTKVSLLENLRLFTLAYYKVSDRDFSRNYTKWIKRSIETILSFEVNDDQVDEWGKVWNIVFVQADQAMDSDKKVNKMNPGGIDFNSQKMDFQLSSSGEEIFINVDSEMLARLKNIEGFIPIIVDIQPLPLGHAGTQALQMFLGVRHD